MTQKRRSHIASVVPVHLGCFGRHTAPPSVEWLRTGPRRPRQANENRTEYGRRKMLSFFPSSQRPRREKNVNILRPPYSVRFSRRHLKIRFERGCTASVHPEKAMRHRISSTSALRLHRVHTDPQSRGYARSQCTNVAAGPTDP